MRHGMPLVLGCLLTAAGILPAQERIPLPPPDSGPAGTLPAQPYAPSPGSYVPSPLPNSVAPTSPASPTQPYMGSPAPYSPPQSASVPSPTPSTGLMPPYGPPPGLYGPPPSPPYPPPSTPAFLVSDPLENPFFWVGVDGLVWWTKNQPLSVPIVTTGPGSQGDIAGNLGVPGTTSLNGPLNFGAAGGARLFAGGWFNMDHTIGMDGSIFILGQQTSGFNVVDRSGAGNFVINEPVIGAPFVTQVSAPGVETGGVSVGASSRFGGGDVNLLYNLYRNHGLTFNLLGGYRYLQLNETLTISANSDLFTTTTYTDNMGNVLATAPPGSTVGVVDQFGTRNQFNGGQIGAQFQYLWQRLSVGGVVKLALGGTHEVVTANGYTNVFPINAAPVPLLGGNYANLQIGRYATNKFAFAPELQLKVGYQLAPWARAQIGYDFLYLTSVVRPGNQIDNTYDGVTHPLIPMASSSFWAQGLTFSLQFTF